MDVKISSSGVRAEAISKYCDTPPAGTFKEVPVEYGADWEANREIPNNGVETVLVIYGPA